MSISPESRVAMPREPPSTERSSTSSPFFLKIPASSATHVGSESPVMFVYATFTLIGASGVAVATAADGAALGAVAGVPPPHAAMTKPANRPAEST